MKAVTSRTGVLLGILVFLHAIGANAEPAKELSAYQASLGKWACDARETGSGKRFKAIAEFSVEFDGNTYVERYYEVATADRPSPWKGIFLMSYDPGARKWVRNGVDSQGERNAASSTGWNNNTWVWENDAVDIVIQQVTTNSRSFAIDVKTDSGTKRVVEATCKR